MLKQHYLIKIFKSSKAAVDLVSIMVGIVVIGLVIGIIAATLFAVIPWAQDNAAKASLDSVKTAENATYAFTKDKNLGNPPGYQTDLYMIGSNFMPEGARGKVSVTPGTSGECYLALTTSDSGNIFYVTQSGKPERYVEGVSNAVCDGKTIDDVVKGSTPSNSWNKVNFSANATSVPTDSHLRESVTLVIPGGFNPFGTLAQKDVPVPYTDAANDFYGYGESTYADVWNGSDVQIMRNGTRIGDASTIMGIWFRSQADASKNSSWLMLNSVNLYNVLDYSSFYDGNVSLVIGGTTVAIPNSASETSKLSVSKIAASNDFGQVADSPNGDNVRFWNTSSDGSFTFSAKTKTAVNPNNALSYYLTTIINSPGRFVHGDATYYFKPTGSSTYQQVGTGNVCITAGADNIVHVETASSYQVNDCGSSAGTLTVNPATIGNGDWQVAVNFRGSQFTVEATDAFFFNS